jgi:hypothetical protein
VPVNAQKNNLQFQQPGYREATRAQDVQNASASIRRNNAVNSSYGIAHGLCMGALFLCSIQSQLTAIHIARWVEMESIEYSMSVGPLVCENHAKQEKSQYWTQVAPAKPF